MKQILYLLVPLVACSSPAQTSLTLGEAVKRTLGQHPALEAADARGKAAGARIEQARSGLLPRVQYLEAFQSGNNPVYVFSSLLTQRQFTQANFDIDKLVRPGPVNNFQSQVGVEQTVWDAGITRNQVRAAELGRTLTQEERRRLEMELIGNAARAYHAITLAEEGLKLALEAVRSAEADAKRAETVRAAGMATEADVLAVRVHLAAMQEQVIRRKADAEVTRAALNQAMGMPLDTQVTLATPLNPAALPAAAGADLERSARAKRPEMKMTELAQSIARTRGEEARAMLMPQVGLRAGFEADRKEFIRKGGANWVFAAQVKWNLFDGFRAKQAREEARYLAESAAADRKNVASAVSLQVRKALADARSAQERITVAESVIAQAEESLRIVRNRYGAGLAAITEVLRAQTALLETRTRRLAAVYDQRLAAVAVEQAAGTLQGDSDVLR